MLKHNKVLLYTGTSDLKVTAPSLHFRFQFIQKNHFLLINYGSTKTNLTSKNSKQ